MNTIKDTITVRKLREILFYLKNQEMTVKELRAMLFEADQDLELDVAFDMFIKIEKLR